MHVTRKRRGKKTYYYAVENKRTGKKVRSVKQIYLGTAESMTDIITGKTKSNLLRSKSFGDIALLLYIEKMYNLEGVFNEALIKKRVNKISGKYYLSIIFNRILQPKSKAGINDWIKGTYLNWFWKIGTSSQKLWNHLCYLDDETINSIRDKIADRTFEIINDETFLWDTSNYFTYINNLDSEILAKGKSKEGRHEKNLISHGLLVGKQSGIPVWHTLFKYKHDSKILNEKTKEIETFLEKYKKKDYILIMDKGNNSLDNIKAISKHKFIGSLRSEQIKDLLKIPLTEFKLEYKTKKGNEVRVYDAGKQKLYDSEYTVVVSYETASAKKKKITFEKSLKETFEKYGEIKDKKFKTNISAMNALNKILPRKQLKAFKKEIIKEGDTWKIKLSKNDSEIKEYEQSFGKTAIFTNIEYEKGTDARDVVRSYRSLIVVEGQFKALHNAFLIPITPCYEWTDQKIKAHVFLCFIGLVLVRTLEFVSVKKGLTSTFSSLLEEAGNIRMGLLTDRNRKVNYCFEQMTVREQQIMSMFGLHEFSMA